MIAASRIFSAIMITVTAAMLSGCIEMREIERLRLLGSDQLCRGYAQARIHLFIAWYRFMYGRNNVKIDVWEQDREILIRQEIMRRDAVRAQYWDDINRGFVRAVMTQTELFCAVDPLATSMTTSDDGTVRVNWRAGAGYYVTVNGIVTDLYFVIE